MAAPHVVGVVAQILQIDYLLMRAQAQARVSAGLPEDTSPMIVSARALASELTCSAARGVLTLSHGEGKSQDKVSRNLLLQVPWLSLDTDSDADSGTDTDTHTDTGIGTGTASTELNSNLVCDIGVGCDDYDNCNGHGICQKGSCLCETGFWGDNCASRETGFHCDEGLQFIPYTLFDLGGSGSNWKEAELRVLGPHTRPTFNSVTGTWEQLSPSIMTSASGNENNNNSSSSSSAGHSSHMSGQRGGIIPVVASSMCSGSVEASGVCLAVTAMHVPTNASQFQYPTTITPEGAAITTDKQGSGVYSYSLDVVSIYICIFMSLCASVSPFHAITIAPHSSPNPHSLLHTNTTLRRCLRLSLVGTAPHGPCVVKWVGRPLDGRC